jgi:pyruvate/2-oxoglutarate dehydrogenase complex dihydrolipoamide dehydrogenase (E3) component
MASGRFVGPRTLEVGIKRLLRGTNVIIGAGTHAAVDNTPGLQEAKPLTHVEALELDVVPEHLIVLGGGYVGLEFAQAMRRFGSKVTVVDRNDRLLHRENDDVTDGLRSLFEDEGVNLVLNSEVQRVSGTSGQSVRILFCRTVWNALWRDRIFWSRPGAFRTRRILGWNSQAWK